MVELLTQEQVASLTPQEAERYASLLEREIASQSPLHLAEIMFPETRRWPQLQLLNEYLVALAEYRLTAVGPVPAEQVRWWYVPLQGDTDDRLFADGPHDIPEEVDDYGAETPQGPVVFRLSVSMRPRAGKSRLVTETFPFWLQLRARGGLQLGVGTYSDKFAADWGGAARDFAMQFSQGHDWFPYPQGGQRAPMDVFSFEEGGKIRYVGVGGGITGKTLHALIGDDFIKNDIEAQSEATREQSHRFYDRTWKTRRTRDLSHDAVLPIPIEVLMATRWHEDDVTGHACYDSDTRLPDPEWCILNIPALSKGDGDPLNRPEGEAHPNAAGETRVDMEKLRALDPRGFSALYQGDPSPEGGGLIPNTFTHYWTKTTRGEEYFLWRQKDPERPEEPPSVHSVPASELIRFSAADMAATTKTAADFTVLFVCGYSREFERMFIMHRYKDKITTDQYVDELLPILEEYKAGRVLVENVTYGQKFQQDLRRLRRQGHLGLSVEEMPKLADKVARCLASGLPAMMRQHQILLPKEASYEGDLTAELGMFPFGTHDDQVDALSFAAQYAQDLPLHTPKKERPIPTLEQEIDAHAEKAARRGRSPRRTDSTWSMVAGKRRRR